MNEQRNVAVLGRRHGRCGGRTAPCRGGDSSPGLRQGARRRGPDGDPARRRPAVRSRRAVHAGARHRLRGTARRWARRASLRPGPAAGGWVGVPGMTAPVRDHARGPSGGTRPRPSRGPPSGATTLVSSTTGAGAVHGPFAAVAITFPAPQVATLARSIRLRAARVSNGRPTRPAGRMMLAPDEPHAEILIEPREDADRPDRTRLRPSPGEPPGRPAHGARHARLVAPAPREPRELRSSPALVRAAGETGSVRRFDRPRGGASLALRPGRDGLAACPASTTDPARRRGRRLVPRSADRGRVRQRAALAERCWPIWVRSA